MKDEINPDRIRWIDYDVGDWPVEDSAFGLSVDERYIRWTFDQSGWPSRDNVNGNIFLIWEENGRYYGESFEHIRPRAKLIGANEAKGGGKLRSRPDSWKPVRGRKYGMVYGDDAIEHLVKARMIRAEDAFEVAIEKQRFVRYLRRIPDEYRDFLEQKEQPDPQTAAPTGRGR